MQPRLGRSLALLVLTACDGPTQPTATVPPLEPIAAAPPSAAPRRCGEPGPDPSPPPAVLGPNTCPFPLAFQATAQPQWLWLSTEGLYKVEERSTSPRFSLALDISRGAPHLVLASTYYHSTLDVVPGPPRPLRVDAWQLALEQIYPGPHTRFEAGAWQATGQVRVHARVRLEAAAPPVDAPSPATTACGDPSARRSSLPPALAQHPAPGGALKLAFNRSLKISGVDVEYVTRAVQRDGGPSEARRVLGLRDTTAPAPNSVELEVDGSGGFIRSDRELLLATLQSTAKPATLRRFSLACHADLAVAPPTAPTWLWLGTFGHTRAVVGHHKTPALTVELRRGELHITSPHATYRRPLAPDIARTAYTFDGWLVEIVDVQGSGADRYTDHRWFTDQMIAGVNVQLRISPA